MSAVPALSAIIAATAPLREIPGCVESLIRAGDSRQVEIILAYAAARELPRAIVAAHPAVIFIHLPEEAILSEVLGTAIARARGEIIAITDATCAIDASWISATLDAHGAGHPVIGGAVEPDGLRTLVDWAGYFIDYGAFMLPLNPGVMRHVPGINISLKRWALATGKQYVAGEFWKAYWCQQLKTKGYQLHVEPSMLVFYRRRVSFSAFLRARFDHGRCFAGMRIGQLSRSGRLVYLLGAPLLPFVFSVRFLRLLLPKRRHLGYLVMSFPIVFLGMISWGVGEFCGYLAGAGTSCRRVR